MSKHDETRVGPFTVNPELGRRSYRCDESLVGALIAQRAVLTQFGIELRVALVVDEGLANRAEDLAFEALWAGGRDPVVNEIVTAYVSERIAAHEPLDTAKRCRSGRARSKARHDPHYNQSNLKVRRARTTIRRASRATRRCAH